MADDLITDEQHDVLISLTETLHQVERVAAGEIHCWKWAILALASAVNGSLVCLLSGSMEVGALTKEDCEQTVAALQAHTSEVRPQTPRLAAPAELLKRARREDKRIEAAAGRILTISRRQKWAFDKLFEFRNDFVHFKPSGWVIELSGMANIFEDVLGILDQVFDDGWAFLHLDCSDRAKLKAVRDDLGRVLRRLSTSAP